ncbi:MAG: signal recognition particle-docking protein FtsY [Cyanobacteriota bacterium]|nr:signal recognition particle-docking protein FtsY [Cyanobacteriota bacterium]
MVFDWFQRRLAKPESSEAPAKGQTASQSHGTANPETISPETPVQSTDDREEPPQAIPQETPAPPPEPTAPPTPSSAGIDSDALAWAREAYARLKAEQQRSSREPEPQTPQPEILPEAKPSEPELSLPEPPAEDPALMDPPTPLSLLERAAVERQQRQRELLASTDGEPVQAPPAPAAPDPAPVTSPDRVEPKLGAFDETFTWSAEVLAAQGRRVDQVSLEEIDWLGRLRRGLEKTRRGFVSQLLEKLGDDPLTPEVLDDLESTLLRADVGVQATDQVIEALRARLNQDVVDASEGLRFLKEQLRALLEEPIQASGSELLAPQRDRLNVWLMVGVNGVGKTTTLGKLANLAMRSGYSCLIAAADTFRAAAVEQVRIWGERSGVPVIANPSANADPAAVVYDAIGAAKANGTELVLVDTAGRLQTKHNLMEELSKVRRIVGKLAPEAAVESLLVLDASQGQNGLRQALAFAKAAGLTGVVITKLDGTSRGGVALAVCREVGLPIRFIGAGEGLRDLRPFNSYEFVEALLAT